MDAATIEETNRLRVAMGMKPLPVAGAAGATPRDASPDQAEENYRRVREAEANKKKREEKAAAVRKAVAKAQRFAVLEGRGLGDDDEETAKKDAKSWLKGQKKRQKKIEKQFEEQAAAEAEAARAKEYTSKDLAGVQVRHELSTLLDGDEQILTLKDATVLENEDEGDELENIELREREKLAERLDLKKKRPVYDPMVEEAGEGGILSQYDEEIHGKKIKQFTLDATGTIGDISDILDAPGESERKKQLVSLNLDDVKDAPASDYLDVSEVKIKKPKKKKKPKPTRQRPIDDDDALFPGGEQADDGAAADELMDIDAAPVSFTKKRKVVDDEAFADDDNLQAALALQRRDALKKRKRTRPEDLARELRREPTPESPKDESAGLVIDEIAEFVSNLKPEAPEEKPRAPKPANKPTVTAMDDEEKSEPEDVHMADGESEGETKEESGGLGIGEERTVAEGLGATLEILKSRGIIEQETGAELNDKLRAHQQFIAERNRLTHQMEEEAKRQREADRAGGPLQRMSVREREEFSRKQNAQREFQASKKLQDLFNHNYTPNFNISYMDDYGRELNQKEAFKALSHGFHGKGSGRGKTDKLLKKIEAEKRKESQGILDASQLVGMSSATTQQSKKRREAGVRLD